MENELKTITIAVPDLVHELATVEAQSSGVSLAPMCSALLSDHFLGRRDLSKTGGIGSINSARQIGVHFRVADERLKQPPDRVLGDWSTITEPDYEAVDRALDGVNYLNVSEQFPGFPARSIDYAQKVVDEAHKVRGVEARRNGRGIEIRPNFIWIEALLQRSSGIRVSIFGRPEEHKARPTGLKLGRGSNSRIVIKDSETLKEFIALIKPAYKSKFGEAPLDFDNLEY
jgi:hypothetical protein